MGIKSTDLYYPIEHMLQGLAFWFGYRMECFSGHRIPEAVIVETAIGLLNNHLNHGKYLLKCEYPYKSMGVASNQRADIAIIKRSDKKNLTPVCVMEFKLSDDANGGVWEDVKKMSHLPYGLHKLAILLSPCRDSITDNFITAKGYAKKKIENQNNIPVRVIRAAKAMEGAKPNFAHRAICIELIN